MSYTVLYPIQTTFNAIDINTGLKNLVKSYYQNQMDNILVTKDELNYLSKVKYYTDKGLNKIGLNTFNISKNELLNFLSNKSDKIILGNVPPHLRTSIPIVNRSPVGLPVVSPLGLGFMPSKIPVVIGN